jgi:hypothetical protein
MQSIFAIDPGPTESAYVFVKNGCIVDKNICNNEVLLKLLPWKTLCDTNSVLLAIEMIACYGMPVGAEVFETCVWIGQFVNASRPTPWQRCYRKDIKLHLCGTTKAKDPNVRQALIDRLGPPGTKKNPGHTYGIKTHLWSALAVAVYAADQLTKTNHPTP